MASTKTRNRVIYQSEALYVGQPAGSGPHITAKIAEDFDSKDSSARVFGLVKEPADIGTLCILDWTAKWTLISKPVDIEVYEYNGSPNYAKDAVVKMTDAVDGATWYFEASTEVNQQTDATPYPPITGLSDFKDSGAFNFDSVALDKWDIKPAIRQLNRVQSANYSFAMNRQDVNQFGQLHRIDSVAIDPPTVSLDFSYYINNGGNEKLMGFNVRPYAELLAGTAKNFLDTAKNEDDYEGRNYFILTTPQGTDAVENTDLKPGETGYPKETNHSVIALGNGFVTNYGLEASVGGMPTASVTVEGLNLKSDSGFHNIDVPAVDNTRGTPVEGVKYTLPPPVSGVLNDGAPAEASEYVLLTDPGYVITSEVFTALPLDDGGLTDPSDPDSDPVNADHQGLYNAQTADGDLYSDHAEGWSCLRPGDIEMHLGTDGRAAVMSNLPAGTPPSDHTAKSCHIQSFSIDMPMGRTPLQRLGTPYAYTRPLDFPLVVNISVSAIVSDLKEGNIAQHLFEFENHDLHFVLREPQVGGSGPVAMAFFVKGAQLEGESFSSSIGDNKSVDITFTAQIGGPQDTSRGLMVAGSRGALADSLVERFDPATK